jgi:endonuclease/exonuclease/phosphatase family metal-dependent hydrolase
VLQSFDAPAMPVILLGDLNEWFIYGRTLRRLVSHLYRVRSPRTFPRRYPLFALDRIWMHPGERLVRVDVHRSLLGAGGIGSLSVDRAAILVALKQTLVTKTP